MNKLRTKQGGSVANFVIVGIILALSLVGGLYYLKNYGAEVRKDVAIAEYEQEKSKTEDKAEDKEAKVDSEKNNNKSEPETGVNEDINTSKEELPTTGPNNFYNLLAIFFLSLAFSYYSSSIYQKSRF
ncbi:MAG: hypothetical protein WBI29_00490 [Candidatus Saccharimonadales bacterium]